MIKDVRETESCLFIIFYIWRLVQIRLSLKASLTKDIRHPHAAQEDYMSILSKWNCTQNNSLRSTAAPLGTAWVSLAYAGGIGNTKNIRITSVEDLQA